MAEAAGDADLEIRISTVADTTGADQTKDSIESVTASANNEAKSFENIGESAEQSGRESADAFDQVADGAEHGSESADKASHSLGGIRRVISAIHHESPLLGEAVHAALHPAMAAFYGLLLVIKQVHKAFEDYDKYLEMISSVDLKQLTDSADKQKKLWQESETAAAVYALELTTIANRAQTITEKTNLLIEAIHRQANAQKELVNAEQARALAMIDAAEKAGTITEVQAIEQRLAVQKKGIQESKTIEDKAATDTLKAREDEFANLTRAHLKHAATAHALETRIADEKVKKFRAEEKLAQESDDKIKEQAKKRDEAMEALAKKRAVSSFNIVAQAMMTFAPGVYEAKREEELAPQVEAVKRLDMYLQSLHRSAEFHKRQVAAQAESLALDEKKLSEAQSILKADVDRIHQLETELPLQRQITAEQIKQRELTTGKEVETLGIKAGAAVGVQRKGEEQTALTTAEASLAKVREALTKGMVIPSALADDLTKNILGLRETLPKAQQRLEEQVKFLGRDIEEKAALTKAEVSLGRVKEVLALSAKGAPVPKDVMEDLVKTILQAHETVAQGQFRLANQVDVLKRDLAQINQRYSLGKSVSQ